MPNLLYSKLPDFVEVDGIKYKINSLYTYILKIIEVIENKKTSNEEKAYTALNLFYTDKVPSNISAAVEAMWDFIQQGSYQTSYKGKKRGNEPLYVFAKDHQLIWSSMAQVYGLDWKKHRLHWWEFKAAFDNLPAETTIKNVVSIRERPFRAKMSAEDRENLREAKKMYSLGNDKKETTSADILAELLREAEKNKTT